MMRKKAIFLLLAGVVSAVLIGCGKEEAPPPVATAVPTASVVTAAPGETAAPAVTQSPVETTAAPVESISAPAGQEAMAQPAPGVYTYQSPTAVWTLTLRENGPYTLQKEGDFPHTGESWAPNSDGTISCGPTDLWNEDFADDYGCTNWTLYPDGRCEPVLPA